MKMTIEEKREEEWRTVLFMIQLYCKGKHKNHSALKNPENLCADCKGLADYVRQRVKKCPFMETKTFCSACRVHCYRADERKKIREVMGFSGPRMMFYHPLLAVKHLATTIRMKMENKKEKR